MFPDIGSIAGCCGYFFGICDALVGEVVEFYVVPVLHLLESVFGGKGDRFEGDFGVRHRDEFVFVLLVLFGEGSLFLGLILLSEEGFRRLCESARLFSCTV